jgi:hypothetical protein
MAAEQREGHSGIDAAPQLSSTALAATPTATASISDNAVRPKSVPGEEHEDDDEAVVDVEEDDDDDDDDDGAASSQSEDDPPDAISSDDTKYVCHCLCVCVSLCLCQVRLFSLR